MGFDVTHTGNTQTRVLVGTGEGNPSDGESPTLDSAAACSPEIRNCCWGPVHGLLRQRQRQSLLFISTYYVTRNEISYEGVGAVFRLF